MYTFIREVDTEPNIYRPMKFVLLEDGKLVVGRVSKHKHLNPQGLEVLGAGSVPFRLLTTGVDAVMFWGQWESVGYGLHTPHELRESIRACLVEHAGEIWLE